MPAERAPMRKVREVLRLRHALGVSERQIAVTIGVSRSTVGEYLRRAAVIGITWPVPEGLDDAELERRLFTPPTFDETPARPLPDWPQVHKELKRRAVTLLLLWEEYRAEHADGYGYSRFCDLYRDWRQTISPTMRQTHGPAEKLFVDFAGDTVPVFDATTGTERRAHVFVAVLGASNYTYAEARWSEGLADWIGAHVNALNTIGGVPKAVVCDNLKAGVTAACRYEPGINRTYQEFAEHYDTAILPTRPRKPRDKAKVEVAVQIVQRFVLARLRNRRFFSLYELNAAIRETVADSTPRSCASSASAATSCLQRSIGRRSKPFRRRPISLPSGRSVGPRPTTTLRSPITITPCRRASSASNSRHASPTPRSSSCTKASVWRAMPVLMRAVGTQRFPSTCRARTGATPSGRRPG
jgi:transposase